MMKRLLHILPAVFAVLMLWGCSSTRHVPEGELLLNSVKIRVLDDSTAVTPNSLVNYLRQQPNHKVLGFAKLSLGVYNLSGHNPSKWYNKWVRRLGQEPVIYDDELTRQSLNQLGLALLNRGYNDASVTVDTIMNPAKKKIDVIYNVTTGTPHFIESLTYQFDDTIIGNHILLDTARINLREGALLDRNLLENERELVASRLRDQGFYTFSKDYITFIADTLAGSKAVDLTMRVRRPEATPADSTPTFRRYFVERVIFNLDPPEQAPSERADTVVRPGFEFIYHSDHYLRPGILEEKCFIRPGELYSASDVNRTYEALTQLGIVRYVTISMVPVVSIDGIDYLNAVVTLSRTKKQGITFEVEGTNSEGDFGVGASINYNHRNLAHGAEALNAKLRASFETLSGDLSGFVNSRLMELGGEVGITFPKFEAPFLSKNYKRKIRATTEFSVSMNYQERPEYTRIIGGVGWKYRWNNPRNTWRHTFDLLDLNLVYLPSSTIDFINTVAPQNPLLRYSYEDHLIMRMGYNYYRTNRRQNNSVNRFAAQSVQPVIWTLRLSAETAGNLLYGISNMIHQHKSDGAYKVFGVQYAQYVKGEANYTRQYNLSSRNVIALHVGAGIGYPYGNSKMIPFEKRFFAGGANSVRGWSVRTLGPGAYDARNSVIDFINQCGDITLSANVEYRAKLFWVLEGALFVDAGNIWTIRDYENQPGGLFRFNTFYKQIALAYGAGIRLDFSYFLLRFDLGMKAHNPARGQEAWPIAHPRWRRDHAFHLSIGYPF